MLPDTPKTKLSPAVINTFRTERAKGTPSTAICDMVGITRETYSNWLERAKLLETKILDGEVDKKTLQGLDALALTLSTVIRESRGKVISKHIDNIDNLAFTSDPTVPAHVRMKSSQIILASEDPEHFGNRPQATNVQVFNAVQTRDALAGSAMSVQLLMRLVNEALPGGTIEERRALLERFKRSAGVDDTAELADYTEVDAAERIAGSVDERPRQDKKTGGEGAECD